VWAFLLLALDLCSPGLEVILSLHVQEDDADAAGIDLG
jgi:hypothetical protein